MPGYGILDANSGRGLLPWNWATERLMKARTYWIATTHGIWPSSPFDGKNHARGANACDRMKWRTSV